MTLPKSSKSRLVRKEWHPSVAHKSNLLIMLIRYVNERDLQDLAVGLKRCIDQLTSALVYLPMLGGDQASDRRRTREVHGNVELLDRGYHAQQHSGQRIGDWMLGIERRIATR